MKPYTLISIIHQFFLSIFYLFATQHQEQKRDTSEKDAMSYEEAALVPLSDELRGSLRMIAPKGCSIRYYKNLYYYAVI